MAVEPPAGGDPPAPQSVESDAALARRAQILATEHWGLLAARSTAQSEVLTRITIYLTLVSAGLVTIGLLGQATRFDAWFSPAALAILAFLSLVGAITHTRVFNVAEEDLMYVVAMNRLRGAYLDLDPSIGRYFLSGVTDDEAGMQRTYSFLRRRSVSHLFGSSAVLIAVVHACVLGLFVGGLVLAAGAPSGGAVAVGVTVTALVVAASVGYGAWTYRSALRAHEPLRRSSERGAAPQNE
jgi:membrane protein YdbS with pleckstrin-like domain